MDFHRVVDYVPWEKAGLWCCAILVISHPISGQQCLTTNESPHEEIARWNWRFAQP